MEANFLKIFNMSITASYFVLAVLLLRLLLKKAPRVISVGLWALVGLRLILPFSLVSSLSLIPSTQTLPENIAFSPAPSIQSGIPVLNEVINPILETSLAPNPVASVNPIQIVLFVAGYLWILGMVLMGIYALISSLRMHRQIRESIPLRENIYLCDRVTTPFILGLFRPKIYLPSAVSAEDVPYILAHENAHIKRKDHLWKPLGFLLLSLHWFNPLMWVAYILLCRDIEAACDEKVIHQLGIESKKPYSQALISCSVPRRSIAACPLAFGETGVKGRIKGILRYKKPAFWVILIAIILCIALAVGFLTDPAKPENDISGSEPFSVVCADEYPALVGDVEHFILNFDGNYSLQNNICPTEIFPVWCLSVNNTGKASIRIEIDGTVYTAAPEKFTYIYAADDWLPGEYPVSFSSTLPMEGTVRCSLHPNHGFSSAVSPIGGADNPDSVFVKPTKPEDYLSARYPQYYGLPTANGLKVYVWQMAVGAYSCALVPADQEPEWIELVKMDPVTIPQMRQILDSYNIQRKDISLCPVYLPHSSYYYEIDDAYRKQLEKLFFEPLVIHDGQNFNIELTVTPVKDQIYDLSVTYTPGENPFAGDAVGKPYTWEMCELSIWYSDTWYPIDEYLRDICKRTDVPERLPWSMEMTLFSENEPFTQRVDLGEVYNTLPAGKYRLLKQGTVSFNGKDYLSYDSSDRIPFLCKAEFTIE